MRKITLLKTIMLAFTLIIGSGSVRAQLLVEDFNYTTGTLLTANGWTAHSGAGTSSEAVSTSSISYTGYASSGIGGEVALVTSGEDVNKTFTAQTTGTIFASFLVNVASATTTGDYFFHIGAATISTNFRGRIFVKKDASNNIYFGISQGTTAANYTTSTYALNTTYLIVLKYEIVAGTGNDKASIYINPALNTAIPATGWITNTDGSGTDLTDVGSVALRQGSSTLASTLKLDGIRISTLWSDIVGTEGSSCTTSSLAFASPTINKLTSDAMFTVTPTTNSSGAVTYLSSVGTVASVNNTTGEVTIAGVGTTVITANQAADATYCANSATYTLNVTAAAPTITITEVTIPAFSAIVGNTDTETINVSGANLTANIVLTIDGANATMFSVNSPLSSTGGVATIIYTPTAPGIHTATLRLNSTGAPEETRTLSGTATLATPVATDANGVSQSGFTANWNAVSGATGYELSVYTKSIQSVNATDLFISEYIEGSSFNKAIEIFNGTGASVDLSTYSLRKQSNGAGVYTGDFPLTGTLANNAVHVVAHSSANASILALANQTIGASPVDFNGNDAVGLFKNGTQIDEVGVFNQTTDWGKDITLIRNSNISAPKVPYADTDWNSLAIDNISNLGSHTMTGAGLSATQIAGSPFTVTGDISKAITGLIPLTTYYYTVVAKNGLFSSVTSNEITVTTSPSTALDNLNGNGSVYTLNGNVVFNAPANQTVEIYNAVGQRIVSKNTVEGLNSIPVTQKGVMLVKVSNQVSKVIL